MIMIKQWIHKIQWLASLLVLLFMVAGCSDAEFMSDNHQGVIDENGMVNLTIHANVPGLKVTRSVDINGEQITTLWVLAFNENGYMISRTMATEVSHTDPGTGENGGSGSFTVKVPSSTRILHFLANVNLDNFSDQENIGRHENEVIAPLLSSSGNLVYWGRKAFNNSDDLISFAQNPDGVILYRNQALVKYSVEPASGVSSLKVLGWSICNQYAYGTVAPFDANAGENDTPYHFDLTQFDFVTTLPEAYRVKMTDDKEVGEATSESLGDPRYIFDNPNSEDDQLYMIMKIAKNGNDPKYYKILLVNDKKEPYQVIRNHLYTVTITNINESYGVGTFEEAKTAAPANNPWIMISDEIPEVTNNGVTLRIEGETTVIYQDAGSKTLSFYYDGDTQPEVTWISNDGVTDGNFQVNWSKETPEGTITFDVNAPVPDRILYATLQIKEVNGPLSRRIKILSTEPFKFQAVWVSSEIPLLNNENITILFEIPDNFPQELLPIDVKFGCDLIDAQTNESLKVITEENHYIVPQWNEEKGQWEDAPVNPGWNYKYVYSADNVGQHRVTFRTILNNISNIDTSEFHIYMEGDDSRNGEDLFKHRDLYFAFQPTPSQRRILLKDGDGSTNYASRTINNLNPVYGETISIPFTLGTLFNGSFSPQTSVNSEIWVYYDRSLVKPTWEGWNEKEDGVDYYGNHYAVYKTTKAENTLTFMTISPNFDCNIVLSAKSKDRYGDYYSDINNANHSLGVNDVNNAFRSAAVTIHSIGRLDFNPALSIDGNNFTPVTNNASFNVAYGTEKDVYLRIDIPEAARGKEFLFNIGTKYFTPVDEGWKAWPSSQGSGYTYTVNTNNQTQVFHLKTNRLVSAEKLILTSGNYIGFNEATVEIINPDLQGIIKLPTGVNFQVDSPYIVLERRDGTRIGTFTLPKESLVGKNETNYSLALRGEYNLEATNEVIVKWAPVEGPQHGKVYIYSCLLRDLMSDNVTINLKEQQ